VVDDPHRRPGRRLRAAFADAPLHRRRDRPRAGDADARRPAAAGIAHEATVTFVDPRHAGQLARTAARDAGIVAKFVANPPDERTPLHDELGVGQRVAWSATLPLDGVRTVAHAFGATINDVLLAAVTGVLGDHMRGAGATVPEDIHAMVPFNLRATSEPLPRDLGNRFGLLLLGLPVGIQAPVTRLLEVRRRTDAIKHSHEGQIAYGILAAMGTTPSPVEARLIDLFSAKATAVMTNVPGPREPLWVTGARLNDVLVWAPSSGSLGLSVSIFSYAGHVTIGFLVNRRLIDDPQPLADGEVLLRGPNVFAGYNGKPEATAQTLDEDGWLHTGDLGEVGADGFLRLTGRKKELIITSSGKNVSPANIEAALRDSRWLSQAVVYGDRRPYLVALLTLDPDEAAALAAELDVAPDVATMARDPRVHAALAAEVDAVNARFARIEQIKRFAVLEHDLSHDAGELTPTQKLRRADVYRRYADRFAGLYAEEPPSG
jgi:acyl-CoA synthetase (AMP-forming)/AMP-acid ligase II